jgi:ribosomal protein L14E/L6E/L27E
MSICAVTWFLYGSSYISGPFKINACPMRRISQNFVIATSTKLDISGVKLPDTVNDKYFKRNRQKRAKKAEGDIFSTKKEVRNGKKLQTSCLFPIFKLSVGR